MSDQWKSPRAAEDEGVTVVDEKSWRLLEKTLLARKSACRGNLEAACSSAAFQSSAVMVLADCGAAACGSSFAAEAEGRAGALAVSNRLSKKLLVRFSGGRLSSGSIKVGSAESGGATGASEMAEAGPWAARTPDP